MMTVAPAALHLAAIVESSDDAIISETVDGTIESWNSAAERMFGYTSAEAVGQSIELIVPPDRRDEERDLTARIRRGETISHFETQALTKNGELLPIAVTMSPVKTPDGEIISVSRISRDMSQQRALEREALRLAAIVEYSEDAIVSKDLDGIVQTWNPAAERMFGYPAAEMVGRPITTIIPRDRWPEEDNVLSRIRSGKRIEHFETIRQRKDGTLIEISLSVSPIRRPDGTIIGASKIARDITPQRRLARQAEEANRVKDEFLAMLSHELRTPLNAVLGYTRMLRTGHLAGGGQERAIEIIERNANILSQLVSDVLDVSSIVTGKVQLKRTDCDLVAVLATAVDVVRPAADSKGVALRLETPDTAIRALCDGDRLQQVFWNLLSNGVKFTPGGGSVDVRLTAQNGVAQVTVTDTGIGISAQSLPYLFQRFWQAERPESRQVGSLGLGLALARHFVELHGGTIAASSEGEGKGATFRVELPLSAERS